MENLVAVLTQGVTAETIFTVVGQVMPFVVAMIPISLGLYMLIRGHLYSDIYVNVDEFSKC